jgi:hypothetical protein
VGRQLVTMGVGVGGMPRRECRFGDRFVLFMRQGIIHGVMAGVFQMAFTVLAGPGFYCHFFLVPARG